MNKFLCLQHFLLFTYLLCLSSTEANDGEYLIGTGIHDMTGPAAQINFMGYAKPSQTAHGIHQRLWARAFIISEVGDEMIQTEEFSGKQERRTVRGSSTKGKEIPRVDPRKTICFVSIDAGMGSDILNFRVIERLSDLIPSIEGMRLCRLENMSISGTHTHSAPAGFLQYTLFQITSFGFSQEVFESYVEGVAQAIFRAYQNLQSGTIRTGEGLLWDANINRSPTSYLQNPQRERDLYSIEGDTDKTMVQLSFIASNGQSLGLLNWFAVHGTSMNSTNQLISGDNKGYASYLMERLFNGNDAFPGKGDFVAAFASTNLGDVSPNTNGPHCVDTGLPCDLISSACNGRAELCIANGPGRDMYDSTEIIGRKQFEFALDLHRNASLFLHGDVAYRHSYIDMAELNVTLDDGKQVKTCMPALGYSFAAGTTDGPGDFDFTQGTNTSNIFWNTIGGFLSQPSSEQIECQAPKPILLNTGDAMLPYPWDPKIVPISVFRIGNFFILNVPGEFTTMAGRRLRNAIRNVLVDGGVVEPTVTIAGLANTYSHYITTFEEYSAQRYEAASTLYGPHTLSAYIQEFKRITVDLLNGAISSTGVPPNDYFDQQISLIAPVEIDSIGFWKEFGSVAVDIRDEYATGETVIVSFRSANPRNNPRLGKTFLTVEELDVANETWVIRYVDNDWSTKYIWKGGFGYFGESFAEVHWSIPYEANHGVYRICHFGTRKSLIGDLWDLLYRLPTWLSGSLLMSAAASLITQTMRFVFETSGSLQHLIGTLHRSRYIDFEGCTKAFLVRKESTSIL